MDLLIDPAPTRHTRPTRIALDHRQVDHAREVDPVVVRERRKNQRKIREDIQDQEHQNARKRKQRKGNLLYLA